MTLCLLKRSASMRVNSGGMCCTMTMGTGKSAGIVGRTSASALGPPVEVPIARMSIRAADWGMRSAGTMARLAGLGAEFIGEAAAAESLDLRQQLLPDTAHGYVQASGIAGLGDVLLCNIIPCWNDCQKLEHRNPARSHKRVSCSKIAPAWIGMRTKLAYPAPHREGQCGEKRKDAIRKFWSREWELNPRPADYESAALPLSYLGQTLINSGDLRFESWEFGPYLAQKFPNTPL
jgi:hypothetical protein